MRKMYLISESLVRQSDSFLLLLQRSASLGACLLNPIGPFHMHDCDKRDWQVRKKAQPSTLNSQRQTTVGK